MKPPRALIILGPAGSGKGTQASRTVDRFGYIKVEAGDLLRKKSTEDSELGRYIHHIHESGQHVTDEVITTLVRDAVAGAPRESSFLFDGYPRTLGQANDLNSILQEHSIAEYARAVWIRVSDDVARTRLLSRSVCSGCKTIFPTRDLTQCPKCGARVEVRDYDHDVTAINKRLEWFHDNVMPAIALYRKKGMLVEVNGEQEEDAVFLEILTKLGVA